MENEYQKPTHCKASILNAIFMTLVWLTAIFTLSVGLAFYYLVPGSVGMGVGIAMYVVTALVLIIGEYCFWKFMCKIKNV